MSFSKLFTQLSNHTSRMAGHPSTFIIACCVLLIWAITGPLFNFSDTWQLAINTGTTIITFLMVFLIQSTQNRDTTALQLKIDELLFVTKKAHNALLDIEKLSDEELSTIRKRYEKIAMLARESSKKKNEMRRKKRHSNVEIKA